MAYNSDEEEMVPDLLRSHMKKLNFMCLVFMFPPRAGGCQLVHRVLVIPHNVIKKGRPHGARHGKTDAQKEHFLAQNARRRCIKKNFDGIHDRFQRDSVYRDSQLIIGWTEEKCIEMDELAQEDFTYRPSTKYFEREKRKLGLSL